ncbi:MAG: class I SAM-dependent methyltransferase [Candidatus Acidiferrales bacterium]|jgi:ubiquinone/menaquinone biosynthesis C-methylase UbiE
MPYTSLDKLIARQRFRMAYPYVRPGSRVCDLGCGIESAFLDFASDKISEGIGMDHRANSDAGGRWKHIQADLHSPLPLPASAFDHVVMLAVLEHLPQPEPVLRETHRILVPGGSLILTWPSALVDPILAVLRVGHLISHEMESDEHQKRIPVRVLRRMLEGIGFSGFVHRYFEFGLNHLLVATRAS